MVILGKEGGPTPLIWLLALAAAIWALNGSAITLIGPESVRAQSQEFAGAQLRQRVRSYRTDNERQIIADFARLLQIPNLASDTPNINKNAQTILTMMRARRIET